MKKQTHLFYFILFLLLVSLVVAAVFLQKRQLQSDLGRDSGFYSMLFFILNHAIYCEKHNINYTIRSTNWAYKYKDGWQDYFEEFEIRGQSPFFSTVKSHGELLGDYAIQEYKEIVPKVYRYNRKTKERIAQAKQRLGLLSQYDCIFIRRGDKLITGESHYYNASVYLDLLRKKNPQTHTIFVQTDDYTCIEELDEYMEKNALHIKIRTLCKPSERGAMVFNIHKEKLIKNVTKGEEESQYIKKNFSYTKTVEEMDRDELYEHTITMLVGIDLVSKSNICVCDYESNVGRFIKLFHNNSNKVYSIMDEKDIDYTKRICPSYSF